MLANLSPPTPAIDIEQAEQGLGDDVCVLKFLSRDPHNVLEPDDAARLLTDEIDIDCKGLTPAKAMSLAENVFDKLRNLTGTVGDRNVKAVEVASDWLGGYDPPKQGERRGRHVVTVPIVIHHEPNV
jgi:hypothetical protein